MYFRYGSVWVALQVRKCKDKGAYEQRLGVYRQRYRHRCVRVEVGVSLDVYMNRDLDMYGQR